MNNAEPETTQIENKWPLLWCFDPRVNSIGCHDTTNALCLEDGRIVTVSHWPHARDVTLKIVDPPTHLEATTGYTELLPRVDAGVLRLRSTGSRFQVAAPVTGEPVDVTWFKVTMEGKNILTGRNGHISGPVKIRVQYDGEGAPHYTYADPDENGSNTHVRPTVVLDEPIQDKICGAAVCNKMGQLVGMINASKRGDDGLIRTLIMTPLLDILAEKPQSPQAEMITCGVFPPLMPASGTGIDNKSRLLSCEVKSPGPMRPGG